MKKPNLEEYKGYDTKSLREAIKKAKGELSDLVLDKNMNKLSDLNVVSKKRKDIAQLSTILRQKELLAMLEAKVTPKVEAQAKLIEGEK